MKVEFLKWGNSLALPVPKAFAQELGASVGKVANIEVRDGKLVVEIASAIGVDADTLWTNWSPA